MKHTTFFAGLIASAVFQIISSTSYSQIFFHGNYVEIGFDNMGGYEGMDISGGAPAGSHPRGGGGGFGFVANPQMDGWLTFNGDYFMPGSPENGWGFEIDTAGISGSNNCAAITNSVIGAFNSFTHTGTTWSADWEGVHSASNLTFQINYNLDDSALFYITTISVTNNGSVTIPAIYYYRNLDPDNNMSISGDFMTTNTIVSQHTPGSSDLAFVTATSLAPATQPMSYLGLMGLDTAGWMAGYGGFSNRDASDCYYGTGPGHVQTTGSTIFADVAIFLSYRIQSLAPGATQTFKFATLFSASEIACATIAGSVYASDVNICSGAAPVMLTSGTPLGGTYAGTGIIGDTLDPSGFAGTISYTYTYLDTASGCGATTTGTIMVHDPDALFYPLANVCHNASPYSITDVYPAGGMFSGTGVSGSTFDPSVGPGLYEILYVYTDAYGCSDSATQSVQVDDCTGIDETGPETTVSVSPNPFTEETLITIGEDLVLHNAEFFLMDVSGREVMRIKNILQKEFKLERKHLSKGMYFYTLINDGKEAGKGKVMIR